MGLLGKHLSYKSLLQQSERLALLCLKRLPIQPSQLRTEHAVVDARHQRCITGNGCRLGQLKIMKLMGCIVKVGLIEHAMLVVLRNGRPTACT